MNKPTFLTLISALLVGLIACQTTPQATTESSDKRQSVAVSQTALPGKGVTVRTGTGPVFFGRFVAEIVNIGLEKLGYNTEDVNQLNPSLMHVAIGNGDLDFSPVHLDKSHAPFFNKGGGEAKLERVGEVIPRLAEGYQIDQRTAEQYKITNLEQLKDPKIAKIFDSDGDGKANLAGCDVGRACERTIDHHLKARE
jgi:glycine betaine/proline transport system substrate-binding protein